MSSRHGRPAHHRDCAAEAGTAVAQQAGAAGRSQLALLQGGGLVLGLGAAAMHSFSEGSQGLAGWGAEVRVSCDVQGAEGLGSK